MTTTSIEANGRVGVERVPQPQPHRQPGGDCFACALRAVLGHLVPERETTFEDTDRWFTETTTSGSEVISSTWFGMDKALWRVRTDGWPIEWEHEQAMHPQLDIRRFGHAWVFQDDPRGYGRRLQAWLAAGWVPLTTILFDGGGPFTADMKANTPDHFVVLDGVRQRGDDHFWNNPEIHVVCSAKGSYWIDAQSWCRRYGGLSWLLVRRTP